MHMPTEKEFPAFSQEEVNALDRGGMKSNLNEEDLLRREAEFLENLRPYENNLGHQIDKGLTRKLISKTDPKSQ